MDWLKKNIVIIILQFILIIITSALGYSFKTAIESINKKADKGYVKEVMAQHEDKTKEIIEPIKQDIKKLEEEDKAIRVEFLQELRLLRQDWRQDIKELYKSK